MSSYNINFYLAKGIFLGKLKNVKCKDKASVFFNRDKASDSNQFSMNFNWSRPIFTKYLNHRGFFFYDEPIGSPVCSQTARNENRSSGMIVCLLKCLGACI